MPVDRFPGGRNLSDRGPDDRQLGDRKPGDGTTVIAGRSVIGMPAIIRAIELTVLGFSSDRNSVIGTPGIGISGVGILVRGAPDKNPDSRWKDLQ